MKRLILLAVPALLLLGVATVPAGAGAGARRPASIATASRALLETPTLRGGDQVLVHDTLAWLRQNTVGSSVGPSRRTGYGKATITGIVKGCPECTWYRAALAMSNHQPTSPTRAPNARHAHRRGGFCWPWDYDWFSGDSCWNEPATWNWGSIWDSVNPDTWHPWNPDKRSMIDRLMGCLKGTERGLTFKVGYAAIQASVEAVSTVINISPEGWIVAAIGGCFITPYH